MTKRAGCCPDFLEFVDLASVKMSGGFNQNQKVILCVRQLY